MKYFPMYTHKVKKQNTRFIGNHNYNDFYYRFDGKCHVIDVRYSDRRNDFTEWIIVDDKGCVCISRDILMVIPDWIREKALRMAGKVN